MHPRIPLFVFLTLLILTPSPGWSQTVLDDVRQNILNESREEIRAISEEVKRQKKLKEEEKRRKKRGYQEKIKRTQKMTVMEKRHAIISESEDLLKTISDRAKFKSEKRWQYEELIKIYAEKPVTKMSPQEQQDLASRILSSATRELIELLKKEAPATVMRDDLTSKQLIAQLNQYTQLVKRIELSKAAQPEQIIQKKDTVVKSTAEFINFLKKEAIRRAELKTVDQAKIDKQKKQFKDFDGIFGLHYSYDSNINADDEFKGGLSIRNYLAVSWLPSLNEYLKGELGTWYLSDNFLDEQDVTFRIAAGQTSFKWHPYGTPSFMIQPGFEWSDTYYPNNETLSTKEKKVFINIKHKFWEKWSQELNYADLRTAFNDNRLARDGLKNDMPGNPLRKRLHSLEYSLGFPFVYKTTLKIKQKGKMHRSNDAFTDFYDYHAYKITSDLGRSLTQKIYAKATLSYEQKDYTERTVDSLQVAQGDRQHIQKVTLFYFLNEDWLLNYTWARTEVDSNNVLYDYKKMTYLLGAYYSF